MSDFTLILEDFDGIKRDGLYSNFIIDNLIISKRYFNYLNKEQITEKRKELIDYYIRLNKDKFVTPQVFNDFMDNLFVEEVYYILLFFKDDFKVFEKILYHAYKDNDYGMFNRVFSSSKMNSDLFPTICKIIRKHKENDPDAEIFIDYIKRCINKTSDLSKDYCCLTIFYNYCLRKSTSFLREAFRGLDDKYRPTSYCLWCEPYPPENIVRYMIKWLFTTNNTTRFDYFWQDLRTLSHENCLEKVAELFISVIKELGNLNTCRSLIRWFVNQIETSNGNQLSYLKEKNSLEYILYKDFIDNINSYPFELKKVYFDEKLRKESR